MPFFVCALVGYCFGCFNPATIMARLHGFDIHKEGSGNAGASNIVITLGKKAGAVVAACDILKTILAIKLMSLLFPLFAYAYEVTGVGCIVGHIFPVQMKFKGGKGLACLAGIVLYFNVALFFILLAAELLLAFLVNYLCVVPITVSVIFPLLYAKLTGRIIGAAILGIGSVFMLVRHTENLRRIRNGTELPFSNLWTKEKDTLLHK